MALNKFERDLSQLRTTIQSATSLIATFQSSISSSHTPAPAIPNAPHPLRLLHDASSLLRAQTTKLSLLILNKPFTPSAISTITTSISSQCLPALMSALQLCQPEQYTSLLRNHLKAQIARILREMRLLLESIPTEDIVEGKEGRSVLANTGVLWEICDGLVNLAISGVVQLAAQKAEDYHALLKDAISELEDWNPDEEDEEDGFDDSVSIDDEQREETVSPPVASMNAMALTPPPTPTPIRRLHTRTLSTLRLIRLLYPALKKRRIQTFPSITSTTAELDLPSRTQVSDFDRLMRYLQSFSEAADTLAGTLYNHDQDGAEHEIEGMKTMALQCVRNQKMDWNGLEDEFSAWSEKWQMRLEALTASAPDT